MISYTTKIIIPFLDEKVEVSVTDGDEFRSVDSAFNMRETVLRKMKNRSN